MFQLWKKPYLPIAMYSSQYLRIAKYMCNIVGLQMWSA